VSIHKGKAMENWLGEMALKFLAQRSPILTDVAWTLMRSSLSLGVGVAFHEF
jgi:hypothetical protein